MKIEERFLYRFISVLYYFGLLLSMLGLGSVGYSALPYKQLDSDKSYVICQSGNIYSFDKLDIRSLTQKNTLASDKKEEITEKCSRYIPTYSDVELLRFRDINPKYKKLSDPELAEILYNEYHSDMPKSIYLQSVGVLKTTAPLTLNNYSLYISYLTEGSWGAVFAWWIIGAGVMYLILRVLRETMLYLAFGKKFDTFCRAVDKK